jgi:hypothetical protein
MRRDDAWRMCGAERGSGGYEAEKLLAEYIASRRQRHCGRCMPKPLSKPESNGGGEDEKEVERWKTVFELELRQWYSSPPALYASSTESLSMRSLWCVKGNSFTHDH